MNEPHRGYVELHSPYAWDFKTDLAIGFFPSAAQSCVTSLSTHRTYSQPDVARQMGTWLGPPGLD